MAGWNGSDREGAAPVQPKVTAKKPSPVRGLIAGGAVVVLAVVAYFAFFSGSEKPKTEKVEKEERGRIKEVTPAVVRTNDVVSVAAKEEPKEEHNTVGKFWYTDDGKKMITLERHGVITNVPVYTPANRKQLKHRIFSHRSENAIAHLLTMEPGTQSFGRRNYKGMTEDFLKSCQEPIIVTKDDDEYTAHLKRMMNETKIELKERIDAGENLDDILTQTHEEYKKLGEIKRSLETEVRKLLRDSKTPEDMSALVDAANKMLADKGISPIKINPIIQQRIADLKGEGTTEK